ncbi:hypothetical protein VNI00_012753 [Paramarasmius palmivorus]|uniref:F-box domain-containing protein n=1 Tax=Paramarasmius palmivorus TaxID=297713 RepID=A0AAW0C3N5_9AGAR
MVFQTCYSCGTINSPTTHRHIEDHPSLPPRFLRSNDLLPYPEHVRLSRVYANAKKDQAWLQSNIEYLERHVLPSLHQKLACVSRAVDEYAVALSPVKHVPTEVLLNIMSLCVDNDGADLLQPNHSSVWACAQVCHRWRAIALDVPSFWCHINVDIRKRESFAYGLQFRGLPAMLETFLARSYPSPLRIAFASDTSTVLSQNLLKIMFQYCSRWKTVTLDVPSAIALNLPPSLTTGAPYLETLTMDAAFLAQDTSHSSSLMLHAPRLKSLNLLGSIDILRRHHRPAPSLFALPWDQLRTLNITTSSVVDFPTIIRHTPNIEYCHLEARSSPHVVLLPQEYRLPKLRTLRLTGHAVYLLRYLSAPVLVSLIVDDTPAPYCGVRTILAFIERSGCSLKHLAFESIPMSDRVLPLLQASPKLVTLDLNVSLGNETVLFDLLLSALLYNGSNNNCVAPLLKELSISVYSHKSINSALLVDMIKSRRRTDGPKAGIARLGRFRLRTNAEWNKLFDELTKDDGLSVDFELH